MDTSIQSSFGDLLRRYRLAAGLTQEELAEKAQVSPRAISDLERGQRSRPWRDTAQRLAQALGLEPIDRARLEAAARRGSPLVTDAAGPPVTSDSVAARHNLPAPLTSFIGREREIAELTERLRTTRLLTLTGVGGCGKTRLALRVGADLLDAYPDGVWLVELAPVGDPAFLTPTFARALGLTEEPPTPILRTLLDVLRSRHLLLLVDNCEHLIASSAELIETMLKACPNLSVLATSREALGVAGEVAWRVPSLPLPPLAPDARTQRHPGEENPAVARAPDGSRPSVRASWVDEVAESAAVRLFVDRARAGDSTFAVTPANATSVAQICRRLDGIPLALELAAARLRVLNVGQIAARLDDRFQLLTGGSRTALPRQQTLRATLDWSYNLLGEAERRTLRRLSVFSTGCTLEAAEAVSGDTDVLDLLSRLVDKSLVLVDKDAPDPRYWLLETIRQYGHERLVEAEEARDARGRHFAWFLALAERAEPELLGARQVEWLRSLEEEDDNVRAALEWGLDAEPEGAARLAGHLWQFWYFRSQISEGIRWLDAALTVAPSATALYAKLLAANGLVLRDLAVDDRIERSKACSEEAFSVSQRLTENVIGGWALNNLATIVAPTDPGRARTLFAESVRLFRLAGDRAGVAMGLRDLAQRAEVADDDLQARTLFEESLAITREIGDNWNLGWTLAHFSGLFLREGDYVRARAMASEGLALFREAGNTVGILFTQLICGDAARLVGELDQAAALLVDTLARFRAREIGPAYRIDRCLCSLGKLAIQQGDPWRGVVLLGARWSRIQATHVQSPYSELDRVENEASMAAARSALGEDAFGRAWAEGEAMTRQEAIAYALDEDNR